MINVKINPVNASVVKGTTTFVGAGQINANEITSAFNEANAAYALANSAYAQANTGTLLAQSAFNAANNVFPQIQPAYNTANAAFLQANAANSLAQSAYNAANLAGSSANTLLLQGAMASANANIALLFAIDTYQNNYIASVNSYAYSAYAAANLAGSSANTLLLQGAMASANANIALLFAIDNAQNTNISAVNNYSYSAYAQANSAAANTIYISGVDLTQNASITYLQGALNTSNTNASANLTYLQGVNAGQNTNISAVNTYASAAYNQANVTAGGLVTANANIVYLQGALNTANANSQYLWNVANTTNASIAVIQSVDLTQNNTITASFSQANNANLLAQAAFNKANTGGTFTGAVNITNTSASALNVAGSVIVAGDLTLTGNLNISGTANTYNSNTLNVSDPMIYLAANNFGNAVDIGFVGHFVGGGHAGDYSHYQHTGFVRDYNDNKWKLFSNVSIEPSTTVTFDANTVYDTIKVGGIDTPTANIGGIDLYSSLGNLSGGLNTANANIAYALSVNLTQNNSISSSYSQANTANILAQAAYNQANITSGGLVTANSNITLLQSYVNSANANIAALWTTSNNALPNTGPLITVNGASQVYIANTTPTGSTTTGALVVKGGVGIGGSLQVGTVTTSNYFQSYATNQPIYNINGPGTLWGSIGNINTPSAQTWALGYSTSSSSWVTNNSGQALTWANTGVVTATGNVASTSNTTGSLVVQGGLGVSGNSYISNAYTTKIYTTGGPATVAAEYGDNTSSGYIPTNLYFGATASFVKSSGTQIQLNHNGGGWGAIGTPAGNTWYLGSTINNVQALQWGTANNYSNGFVVIPAASNLYVANNSTSAVNVAGGIVVGNNISTPTNTLYISTANGIIFQALDGTSAGVGNYLQTTATGAGVLLRAVQNGTNDFYIDNLAASGIDFRTNYNYTQFRVSHTASTVNYVQVTGAATNQNPVISLQGSDTNIFGSLTAKGTGGWDIVGNGTSQFRNSAGAFQFQVLPTSSAVNYLQASGAVTGNAVTLITKGSDANVSMAMIPQGTGAFDISTANGVNLSSNTSVTTITRISPGSGYTAIPTWTASAPTTSGGTVASGTLQLGVLSNTNITITSGGSGYSVNDTLTFVGGTGTATTLTVASVSGGVITSVLLAGTGSYSVIPTSPVSVTGGTGTGATFTPTYYWTGSYSITNAGSGYVEQPTITITGTGGSGATAYATVGNPTIIRSLGGSTNTGLSFYTPGGEQFRIVDRLQSTVNYVSVVGASTGSTPQLFSGGTDTNVALSIYSKGASPVQFGTNNGAQQQLQVSHTASAVNYVQVTGSATNFIPAISAQGSDSTISMGYYAKGGGSHYFSGSSTFAPQFKVGYSSSSAVNYLQVTGSVSGNAAVMTSAGSDANVSMAMIPQGTGAFDISTANGVNLSSNGSITSITTISNGAGYTTAPTITISQPTTYGGVTATANTYIVNQNSPITFANQGSGYSNNDVITIVGGTLASISTSAGQYQVQVNATGAIVSTTRFNGGFYTAAPSNPVSVTGGTGTGATITLSFVAVPNLISGGSGYVEQPTVTYSGGGGSGATAYAVVGAATAIKSLHTQMNFYTPNGAVNFQVADGGSTTPGYLSLQGGSSSAYGYVLGGSGSNTNMTWISRGTGVHSFTTGSTASNEQFRVAHTASAVNYVQATGAATGSSPVISSQGSDTNTSLTFQNKGDAYTRFNSSTSYTHFRVYSPSAIAAANFLQATGSNGSGVAPVLSSQGTDTNIDLTLTPKGTGGLILGNNQANYVKVSGSATGNTVQFQSIGSDANVSMAFISQGTGAHDIQSANGVILSSNGIITALTRTSGGSFTSNVFPTVTISAPNISGGVQATANIAFMQVQSISSIANGGTGYSVGDVLTISGGTASTAANITVTANSSGVITSATLSLAGQYTVLPPNVATVTGGTGTGASFNLLFGTNGLGSAVNIINAGSGYTEQPTVTVTNGTGTPASYYATVGGTTTIKSLGGNFNLVGASGGIGLQIYDAGGVNQSNAAYWKIGSNFAASGALLYSSQAANFSSSGTNPIAFYTNTVAQQQFNISHTASAVNYVNVTGAATGGFPTLSAQGSDTNISTVITSKNAGDVLLQTGSTSGNVYLMPASIKVLRAISIASAVNWLEIRPALTGSGSIVSTNGSDANIAINLVTTGNAAVQLTGNTTGYIPSANSIYVGNRVGYANANNVSQMYQFYNGATNSYDLVFG